MLFWIPVFCPPRASSAKNRNDGGRAGYGLPVFFWFLISLAIPWSRSIDLHRYPQPQAVSFRFSRERVSGKDRNPGFKDVGRYITPSELRSFTLLVPRRTKTGMTIRVGIGTVLNRKAGCALPFQVFLALPNVQVMENLQAFPHIPLHPAY